MHLKTFLAPKVIIYILGSILYLSFGLCISSAQDSLINAVEKNKINSLVVVNNSNELSGIVQMYDLGL